MKKRNHTILKWNELPNNLGAPFITKMVDCFWCLSTWVSIITHLLYYQTLTPSVVVNVFSVVGVSGMIYTILQNGEK
jgi:hypothetical protein